jgi:hypothetical protein
MAIESEIGREIYNLVWSGFYGPAEIETILCEEMYEPGEIDADRVRERIEEEFRRKRAEEATWGEVTDCDRLDRVFDALGRQGIVCLQNAGMTQSDGFSDVSEAYDRAGGDGSGIVGFCFYHGQDLTRVIEGGDLYLAFGAIKDVDDRGLEVGGLIVDALRRDGFEVEWDHSTKTRILVKGIRWQSRGPDT